MGLSPAGDFCTLPVDAGSCVESLRRFFFNATSWKCEPFIFRGCQGNLNRFITKEECEHNCGMIGEWGETLWEDPTSLAPWILLRSCCQGSAPGLDQHSGKVLTPTKHQVCSPNNPEAAPSPPPWLMVVI